MVKAAFNQVVAAFVVREGSMTDLHETNPKRTAQIDTIGWLSTCPFRKSYPRVAMMQSTQDGHSNDGTIPLDCSMQWRILVQ